MSVAPSQDELDDPDAPPFLPKSNEVGTWVKHRAVRVAIPGELKQLFARDASAIEDFRVKLAASCVYRRIVNDQAELAYVELVQAHQPEDAFGILTVHSTGPDSLDLAGLTRVDTTNGYHLHCWKGHYYVHVYGFVIDDPTFPKALEDLARRITFEMPAASQMPICSCISSATSALTVATAVSISAWVSDFTTASAQAREKWIRNT